MIFSILHLAFRIVNFIELDLLIACHHISFFNLSSSLFFTSETTEDNKNEGLDLNIIPATETLGNEYLMEKKRLAEAQGKKHKPTRASWAKSLDDDDDVCQSCYNYDDLFSGIPLIRSPMGQKKYGHITW